MCWRTRLMTIGLLVAMMSAPAGAAAETMAERGVVRAADHAGIWEEDAIRWRSQFELRPAVKEQFDRVALVRPLGPEVEILEVAPDSVAPVRDGNGRMVGIKLPDQRTAPWNVTLVVRQPVGDAGRVAPPMIGPRAPQRVMLRDAKFTPANGSALSEHPGFVATKAVGRDRRQRIEASFDEPADNADRPVYFRPTDLQGAALPGQVEAVAVHKRRMVWVLGAALALVAGIGAAAYRWLAGRAKEEEAEAILEEHGMDLEI